MAQQGMGRALAVAKKLRTDKAVSPPTYDDISARAHVLWIERGSIEGSSEDDWHRAEQELAAERANV